MQQCKSSRPSAVIFAEYFPPYMGSDRRIFDLARHLQDWSVEFAVVPPLRILGGRCEEALSHYFRRHFLEGIVEDESGGIHGHYFDVPRWLRSIWAVGGMHAGYAITLPFLVRKIVSYLKQRRPDVAVIAHPSYLCGLTAALAAKICGIPVLLDYPDAWTPLAVETATISPRSISGRILRFLEGLAAKQATRVVSITHELNKYIRALGVTAPIDVVPNGADDRHFCFETAASLRSELGYGDADEVVLYSGRLEPWSGVDDLAANVARVCELRPRAKFLFVGDGTAARQLVDDIELLGLRSRVQFLGFQRFAKMPALISCADVAIIPFPRTETTQPCSPVKLFEYMLMRKAIVTTDLIGIRESVADEHVAFVQDMTGNSLALAVTRLLEDQLLRLRLQDAAFEKAKSSHTWRALAASFSQSMHRAARTVPVPAEAEPAIVA